MVIGSGAHAIWGPTMPFIMMLNRLKVECFSLYISHFVVVHLLGRFLLYYEVSTLFSATILVFCFLFVFVFVALRKIARTSKVNNSSTIAQILIKVYIFEKLYVLGIQPNSNFSEIFTFVTSRGRLAGVGKKCTKRYSKMVYFSSFFE